jgi:hypothetical protein
MRWILENHYVAGAERTRCTLIIDNAREADMTDLMEGFVADYPEVTFSSLPTYTETGPRVTLSISAVSATAETAFADLQQRLTGAAIPFRME